MKAFKQEIPRVFEVGEWNITARLENPITVVITATKKGGNTLATHSENIEFTTPEKAEKWLSSIKVNFIKVWILNKTNEVQAKTFKPEDLKTFC